VFNPFFTTKKVGEGSGLGLPMVQGFMRQSGGTVRVNSEVGVGTTFKLLFPAEEKALAAGEQDPSKRVAQNSRHGRILFAEDNEKVADIITAMLEAVGYSVCTVLSGDEAKRRFEADPTFELLLTDIVMPGRLQGPALANELRAINDALPVIFISGYTAEVSVHGNGLQPGDFRLMKPVMRRDLLATVAQALKLNRTASM